MTSSGTSTPQIDSEIIEILVRVAGLDAATVAEAGESTLTELGLDSLAATELQATIEDTYHVLIPDESLEMSVGQIAKFVAAQPEGAS